MKYNRTFLFNIAPNILIYEQNNRTKMQKYTERYEVKLTKEISDTLEELRNRKIVVSKFIRLAIEEKLQRDSGGADSVQCALAV